MDEQQMDNVVPTKRRAPVLLIALVILVWGLLIKLLFWPFGEAEEKRMYRANFRSLKGISLSVLQYCSDNEDRFPPNMDSAEAVFPYFGVESSSLLSPKPPHNRGMYIGNGRLAGTKTTSLRDPEKVIMFFDTYTGEDGDVQVIACADSSTRIVTQQELAKAIVNGYRMHK